MLVPDLDCGRQAAAFEDDTDQVVAGVLHVLPGQARAPRYAADLCREIGVMLGTAPQQEDQVYRVDRVHLSGIDPGLKHGSAALEPGAVVLGEVFGQAGATADDFHCKYTRSLGLAA